MNLKTVLVDRDSQGYYKPFATRTFVLVTLLLITLTLIAITEYACRTIPNHAGIGTIGSVVNGTLKRDLAADVKRSPVQPVARLESYIPILSYYPFSFSTSTSSSSSSSPSPSVTSTATGGYLSLGGSSASGPGKGVSKTTSIVSGGWLSSGDGSTTDPFSSSEPSSRPTNIGPASNQGSQPTSSLVAAGNGPLGDVATTAGAALSNSPTNPVQQPTGVATPDRGEPTGMSLPPDATETVDGDINAPPLSATVAAFGATSFANSLADPPTDSNTYPTPVVIVSNGQTFVETPTPAPVDPSTNPAPAVTVSNGHTFVETPSLAPVIITSDGKVFTRTSEPSPTPVVIVSNGKTFTETPSLLATAQGASLTPVEFVSDGKTITSSPSQNNQVENPSVTPIIVVSDGHTFTETPSYISSGAASTATEPAVRPIATIVNSTGTFLLWPGGETSIYPQITLSQYTLVAFVPLILAVLYTIPFRILDRTTRELEPFYQLSQSGGAVAENSLCLDYSTSNEFTIPIKAGLRGHGYMFWSSLLSLAVVGIAPLSSEALFVSLSGGPGLYGANIDVHYQDYASWGIYPALARLIEGLLSFVAVLIVFMIWHGMRRESGVYGEPLSIVGLATLFHSSPLLRGFRTIDSQITNSQLKEILAGQRYKLGDFMTADYRPCYGLLPADSESGFIFTAHRSKKGPYRLVEGTESAVDLMGLGSSTSSSKRKQVLQVWEKIKEKMLSIGILILNTGMLALISYYHWSEGDIHHGFEKFMDSNSFGVRFMMTMLGVVLKIFWSNLDQEFRRLAPYNRLALSSANAFDSILVPTYMSPFQAIIPCLRQKHFLAAQIAFLSILSEFLPICLANVTYSAATTQPAYEACNDICLTTLILMLISILILILRPKKGVKRLPRSPDTVASVLVYIASQGGLKERQGMLDSMKGMERIETNERNEIVAGWSRTYSLGLDNEAELRVDEDERIERHWLD